MYENEFFTLENKDNILDLTMNAPGNNIMTAEFTDKFLAVVSEAHKVASENNDLKGMIIHGAGRHFCVGADVPSLLERTKADLTEIAETGKIPEFYYVQKNAVTSLSKFPFPVVSVVSGFCIGSGSEIAINSNFRIIEPTTRAGQPESTFGILPALGGITRTAVVCGLSEAINDVLSGMLYNAEYAEKIDWADILVEKKQGYSKAVALIDYIDSLGEEFDRVNTYKYVAGFLESEATA